MTNTTAPVLIPIKTYHADHGVDAALVAYVCRHLAAQEVQGFFLITIELPDWTRDLETRLWGPRAGDEPVPQDEVFMHKRSADRPPSRLVDRPMRPTRQLTAIGVVNDREVVFYTLHGGPAAEREVGDPSLEGDPAAKAASEAFWREHALAAAPTELEAIYRQLELERQADGKKDVETGRKVELIDSPVGRVMRDRDRWI